MADPVYPVHRVTAGEDHFDLAGLMSDEMAQVKAWTGHKNRAEFYQAMQDEDPDALTAAFSLVKWRKESKLPRWGEVRVCLDDLRWSRVVDNRQVELIAEERDGKPLIVQVDGNGDPLKEGDSYLEPTGADGEKLGFVLPKTPEGHLRWRFTDTGEDVRPTEQPPTSGSSGSPSTAKTPRSSGSGSGTKTTEAA